MFVLDCETHRVIEANPAATRTYQMDLETLRAEGVERAVPPHRRADLTRLLDAGLDAPPQDFFSEHILPDRTLMPVEVRSFALAWNQRPARFFLVRDITPRSAAQSAIGKITGERVSGAAAHDFNNLLTVILAVAEQLQEGEGNPQHQVGLIAKTVRSAQEMAKQRLSLGGRQMSHNERLDLNTVLREQEDILKGLLGKQSELVMQFEPLLPPIFSDTEQWREVMLNLAVNARDAMPEGGTLKVTTSQATVGSADADLELAPGKYVRLTVEDTGHGMSEETRRQAFKPYYSTKSRNMNSGLGLASVAAAVQQCGGAVRLKSEPGVGTCIEIFIPPTTLELSAQEKSTHILLVEDSLELRRMMEQFLSGRGYDVVSCGNAEAALKWAAGERSRVDLMLVDLVLPDLPGGTLVEQLLMLHPDSKVIFISGHPDAGQEAGTLPGRHLEKPFALHELAEVIADAVKE